MTDESIVDIRKTNQRSKMLEIIRNREKVSKNDIKKLTNYSMTTVISCIDDLKEAGLIYEEKCLDDRIGRKPIWLKLNPEGGYFIGIEFNRNLLHSVILDFVGNAVKSLNTDINGMDSYNVIKKIIEVIEILLKQVENNVLKVFGIGIGVPGYCDIKKGVAISYRYISSWNNIKLKEIIEDKFNIPCYIENNINIMVYAYKWNIYKGKCEDMLFISVRTGARVIPIINNKLVRSEDNFSGELGHVKVRNGSRLCTCGRYGCLNSEISDYAIINKIKEGISIGRYKEIYSMVNGNLDSLTINYFIESVKLCHDDSMNLLKQIVVFLSDSIVMLITLFAIKKVVLFGSLNGLGDLYFDAIKEQVNGNLIPEYKEKIDIIQADYGKSLGAYGAAYYVLDRVFKVYDEEL